tara:strand:+ start:474 stop:1604 length:1131 start_codon:yes stop_codon:yes gene_type:complete
MKSRKFSIPNSLLPPGFKDDVSDQAAIEHKYKNLIINLFQTNGYKLVKTPLIEYVHERNSNNLKIKTKNKEKELMIRDDITMQVSRLSGNRLSQITRPLKLCYYGEVVRKRGTMLRPERQFLQVGAECIGENSYLADIEMIDLAYRAINKVGIKNVSIELSSRIFIDKIYTNINSKSKLNEIKSLVRKKDLSNVLKIIPNKYHKYLRDIFACTGNFIGKKKFLKKLIIDNSSKIEVNNLINIIDLFLKKYPTTKFILDLTEVEDKNYHNGIRFTIFAENVRGEIARGGRYNSVNKNLKENATGFTCYMDTILRASSTIEKTNKIMIPFNTSENKKNHLIKKNYIIETFFGKKSIIKEKAIEKKCNYYLKDNKIYIL